MQANRSVSPDPARFDPPRSWVEHSCFLWNRPLCPRLATSVWSRRPLATIRLKHRCLHQSEHFHPRCRCIAALLLSPVCGGGRSSSGRGGKQGNCKGAGWMIGGSLGAGAAPLSRFISFGLRWQMAGDPVGSRLAARTNVVPARSSSTPKRFASYPITYNLSPKALY
jgi:hypothetical protein